MKMILATLMLFWSPRMGMGQEQTPIAGIITSVKGKAHVKRFNEKDTVIVKTGQFVREGDVLRIGPKERASLAFMEGAEVRINENTEFEVTRRGVASHARNIKLALGQVWTRLLNKEADLDVQTRVAVAAVRGTEADIEMKNGMTVKVYEGLVDLMNSYGKQSLSQGQVSQVAGAGAAPSAPRQMSEDEKGKWQEKFKIKNLEELLKQLQEQTGASGERKLKLQIEKDGEKKDLELKFKKK